VFLFVTSGRVSSARRSLAPSLSRITLRLFVSGRCIELVHLHAPCFPSNMTGRQAPARPLHDLTNLATPPTSASVNKPKTAGRSRRPASYRQTSIADAFAARPASPVASTSSSPLSAVRSDGAGSARSGAPSSAFATSPLRPYDGNADRADLMDEDASSDAESSTAPRQKRRKFSATSPTRSEEAVRGLEDVSVEDPWLAAAFDTSAMRRAPSLPATRSLAGEQFSCYELMRRRDLGLRTRPSQGQLACLVQQ
jgi:hypothetical protein